MKYGHFDDKRKEYVTDTPKTPLPWINYLGNDGFFSLISNTGGGYSFYKDAKLRRITRYRYNNVPTDLGGRCYYINDNESLWSPCYMPLMCETASYRCRHGLGYTIFETTKNHLESDLTCFVPLGECCEVNKLTLKNTDTLTKHITLTSAVEWCLWDTQDDSQNFQRNLNIGEVEVEESVIYHKTEYRERRDHYAYFSVNVPIDGFDTDRESFLGRYGSWQAPKAVRDNKSSDSVASGWAPIASHRIEITLAPGEEKTVIFLLGYIQNAPGDKWESKGVINKTQAKETIRRFSDPGSVETALDKLADYWDCLLSRFTLTSSNDKLNRMVNIWHQYQCMVTFNLSRSASYFESGTGRGMGFRDSCQDILGFVHLVPERARARILEIASIQFEDGSTYHQYQPLTKCGNADVGVGFNDDPLWLIACTAAYIRETGDASILDALVPFNNKAESSRPLLEHLRRSLKFTIGNLGPHGLPLIGRADWNDCLNLNCYSERPGDSFQTTDNIHSGTAESIFIAAMFIKYGREYAELCRRFGDPAESDEVLQHVERITTAMLKFGWDGEWFLRAYDANGNKVGSHECDEGQIFVEAQGFAVMAGVGVIEGYAKKALSSVRKRLLNKFGIELLSPCYTEYRKELGEISSYPPGYKENGSVFCHNNPWISIAETVLGNADNAFDIYRRTCPAYVEEYSDIHKTEPYVYCQTIAGREAVRYGEAKNSWLTGTAAWAFVNISQAILGIKPVYDGLVVDPCIPNELGEYRIARRYRDAVYDITVRNTGNGTKTITLDGEKISGNTIAFIEGKKHYQVEVDL